MSKLTVQFLKYGNNFIHPSDELESLEKNTADFCEKGGKLPTSAGFVEFKGGKRRYKPRKNKRKNRHPVTINTINYNNPQAIIGVESPVISNRDKIFNINEKGEICETEITETENWYK